MTERTDKEQSDLYRRLSYAAESVRRLASEIASAQAVVGELPEVEREPDTYHVGEPCVEMRVTGNVTSLFLELVRANGDRGAGSGGWISADRPTHGSAWIPCSAADHVIEALKRAGARSDGSKGNED